MNAMEVALGKKFSQWMGETDAQPHSYKDVRSVLLQNRTFTPVEKLHYGDHGLERALHALKEAISADKRIALYADYDVDGTMSCVSWVWFLEAIGYINFCYYIPCRFKEGYGLNLGAVKKLIDEQGAELIVTMDTGITANAEAAYCRSRGVEFICTDHHVIQPSKMPDCIILNPKQHPDPSYQELCGCGITYVLLRQLGRFFSVEADVWNDILAVTGMATICDVVPLNPVNHQLARLGVRALTRSRRKAIVELREACSALEKMNESDVGFRLGPRINAVGRLEHAEAVVQAFVGHQTAPLVEFMGVCNERRKSLQKKIVEEAIEQAQPYLDDPILFLGGKWHPGVVGIAASKLVELYWRPVWLFEKQESQGKGSARSILGFDVTGAMGSVQELFDKFGGHQAAGGYTFPIENEEAIRQALLEHAKALKEKQPDLWVSKVRYDCELPWNLLSLRLIDVLDALRPFGHQFPEPKFLISGRIDQVDYYKDKQTGEPRHTVVWLDRPGEERHKVLFFHAVYAELELLSQGQFLVSASRNHFRGRTTLSLIGHDWREGP